jgi:peroxidase
MYGESVLDINPMNTYPWPLVTKAGRPMVVSAEMAIVYRFHEFIIPEFPIKDATNHTLWNQSVFDTGFNPQGFIDAGLENVLRGTVGTHIPNFKSGVDENFRSAGKYRGKPFDVVTWSIVHEREQGLPTFNVYFRAYNAQGRCKLRYKGIWLTFTDPKVLVPIRNTFEDFSSDPATVAKLKKLYKAPDEVDLVVGVQLDEEMFPGTTVPKSALIISLFSLFGMGNSDRFSIGFAVTKCFLVDKPWDCKPTNALEELLWAPKPHPDFPNLRWLDPFWLTELDFQAHGTNLLWRLITENSDIKCVQQKPLFPADPATNPILCKVPKTTFSSTVSTILLTAVEAVLALYRQHPKLYNTLAAGILGLLAIALWYWLDQKRRLNAPPVFRGWPVVGQALAFQKDPKDLLLKGFDKYGQTPSKAFGLKLASLTHFVISEPIDLELMIADNPYEAKFSLHAFLSAINFPLIVHKDNFESDLHTKLIRTHFGNPRVVSQFGETVMDASNKFIGQSLPSTVDGKHFPKLVPILMNYITAVVGGCIVGDEVFDHPDLLEIFAQFNDHAIKAMGISSLLPSFLQFIAGWSINKDFKSARKILLPIIKQRRKANQKGANPSHITFLDFILDAVDDDTRAAGEY